jgi:hypothetical protein
MHFSENWFSEKISWGLRVSQISLIWLNSRIVKDLAVGELGELETGASGSFGPFDPLSHYSTGTRY